MCGIAGIIDFQARAISESLLQDLCAAMGHRGPDDRGTWKHHDAEWSVGFAHTRLAVLDVRPDARQPMTLPNKQQAIVFNGEIYNHRELRDQLDGPFHTQCDTEVLLHAASRYGPEVSRRLDGMWAFGFVDADNHQGYLSRDPMGIKPLYYTIQNGRLAFASELGVLAAIPEIQCQIDPQAVALYLTLTCIPHPWTIYRNIYKLPPGHTLTFNASGCSESTRYLHLDHAQPPVSDYREATSQLRQRIEQSVRSQMIADVPLGAFLSGGLDSSIVAGCLSQSSNRKVKTFSIGYTGQQSYDETQYAQMVANHLDTEHHTFQLSFEDILAEVEPMITHLSEPFGDSSLLPTSVVSRKTREHVTVALSGDGADELFGGYWRYLGHRYLEKYRRIPGLIRRGLIEPALRLLPSARTSQRLNRLRQLRKLLRGDLPAAMDRHLAWAQLTDPAAVRRLIGNDASEAVQQTISRLYHGAPDAWFEQEPSPLGDLNRILLADMAVGLPADMLHKVDTASMAHSLEVRVPMLSWPVVDFVARLPESWKIQGTTTKRILRDAFGDMLPEAVVSRSKMGFEVPIGEFLRDELRDFFHDVVQPNTLTALGLDSNAASTLYDEHAKRKSDHSELLWSLFVLCQWYQQSQKSPSPH
jgi:asparagine synthase (glutamine-hydrolysing)